MRLGRDRFRAIRLKLGRIPMRGRVGARFPLLPFRLVCIVPIYQIVLRRRSACLSQTSSLVVSLDSDTMRKGADIPHVSCPCIGAVSFPSSISSNASPSPVTTAVLRERASDVDWGAGLGKISRTCSGNPLLTDTLAVVFEVSGSSLFLDTKTHVACHYIRETIYLGCSWRRRRHY